MIPRSPCLALPAAALLASLAACSGANRPQPAGAAQPAASAAPPIEAPEPLRSLLASSQRLRDLAAAATEHRLQVVLGWIEEGTDGRPALRQAGFRSGAEYFYPASAIKLFAAVAAAERLEELRRETGQVLTFETPLVYHPLFAGEVLEETDPTNLAGGKITVRHEIRKLFLVSDNESFNKLYEFTGQDRLMAMLERAGLGEARLVHRLDEFRTPLENRTTPRIDFVGETILHSEPQRVSAALSPPPEMHGLRIGKAYLRGEQRVEEPMDFSGKNRVSLADLQRGLCKIVQWNADCGGAGGQGRDERVAGFALTDVARDLILEAMSAYPRESSNPVYDPKEYPDDWGKYLLPGLERVVPRDRFRIYNKIGQAYGFTTDNAWIVDRQTGRGFFLAATIYTNADGVLNDDQYEYKTVALPFFADLGEAAARWFWEKK
jgi:hypothetical protein